MTNQEYLLELRQVGKRYPRLTTGGSRLRIFFDLLSNRAIQHTFTALSEVTIRVAKGESWGIIGENGAGKSTLMKIAAGVVKPTQGTAISRGRIAALLELGTGFHPEYTGRENVYLAASLMGWTRSEVTRRLDEIIEFADIGEHIELPVKTYSSGMVVRLGFAVATALMPDVLVTDEVLAVGDESFQKKCMRWMDRFRRGGGTMLLCSHSMYQVQSLCEKAVWIHHGKIEMEGDAYAVSQAYLAYHEQKSAKSRLIERPVEMNAAFPRLMKLMALNSEGVPTECFELGSTIAIEGSFYSPDDIPTVLGVGIARIDGTPVYGAFSNDSDFMAQRLSPKHFFFRFVLIDSPLLPGRYSLKAHTLDEYGLRLFDTLQVEIAINGSTREHGFVRLRHRWEVDSQRTNPTTAK
jgi:lipopolysaccharide transport system ATP-binding protein